MPLRVPCDAKNYHSNHTLFLAHFLSKLRHLPYSGVIFMYLFWNSKFIRFVVVGAGLNVVLALVFVLLFQVTKSEFFSLICSHLLGWVIHFFLQKVVVFKSPGGIYIELIKHLVYYIAIFCLNLLLLKIAIRYFDFHYGLSQFFIISFLAFLSFFVQRFFIFNKR